MIQTVRQPLVHSDVSTSMAWTDVLNRVGRGIRMFANTGTGVARCPGSNMRLGQGIAQGHDGAVALIQHFGLAVNLDIHLHCLVLDGETPVHLVDRLAIVAS